MRTLSQFAKLPPCALLIAALAACASNPRPSTARVEDGRPGTLSVAECLDPDRARAWALLDGDQLLVDAGRYRYRIELAYACPDVSTAAAVVFRGSGGLGRVCGHPGDAVVAASPAGRTGQPCSIRSIETLTEAQYRQLLDDGDVEPRGTVGSDGGSG